MRRTFPIMSMVITFLSLLKYSAGQWNTPVNFGSALYSLPYQFSVGDNIGIAPSESAACKTAIHLVNVLNRNLLGRGNVRNGHRIGSGFVFGTGPYGDHPHIHMVLAAPSGLSVDAMTKAIDLAIHQTEGLGHQLVIKHYNDVGWIDYMLDHCSDGFEERLVFPTTL